VNALIDTTEMYLRTLLELEEEGVTPLRVRIAERLGQRPPTVSQTVARMERDGLLHVTGDRTVRLTPGGRRLAMRVLRKHRIAECFLVDVLGIAWEDAHTEACRLEHVMSDEVEHLLSRLLHDPGRSPYGNPIPDPDDPEVNVAEAVGTSPVPLTAAVSDGPTTRVRVLTISEPLQTDRRLMGRLRRAGVRPGEVVAVSGTPNGVSVTGRCGVTELDHDTAARIGGHSW
jgi:DtxR family Mn-dependent transcriptional regulator